MSFTNYYFKLGYQSTLEKVAAKKKDEGMGIGSKLGLGALGAAGLGAGAMYGGQGMSALGNLIDDPSALESIKRALGSDPGALGSIGDALRSGGSAMHDAVGGPMQEGIGALGGMAADKDDALKDLAVDKYDYLKDLVGGIGQ